MVASTAEELAAIPPRSSEKDILNRLSISDVSEDEPVPAGAAAGARRGALLLPDGAEAEGVLMLKELSPPDILNLPSSLRVALSPTLFNFSMNEANVSFSVISITKGFPLIVRDNSPSAVRVPALKSDKSESIVAVTVVVVSWVYCSIVS